MENISNAFSAGAYLRDARHEGLASDSLYEEAHSLLEKFQNATSVRMSALWVVYDCAGQAVEGDQPDRAVALLGEFLRLADGLPDPKVAVNAFTFLVPRFVKKNDRGRPWLSASCAEALSKVLRDALPFLAAHLDWQPVKDGICAAERLLYAVRRLAEEHRDGLLLGAYMGLAVERGLRSEWFAQAWIEAALFENNAEEAVRRGEEVAGRFRRSAPVAMARAKAQVAHGNRSSAIAILEDACRGAKSPWPFAALAVLYEEDGDFDRAQQCLARGLGFHDLRDAGKVWRLHHDRSRLLLLGGRVDEAAKEAWLAKEARTQAGWGLNREQGEFLDGQRESFAIVFDNLDALPRGAVRREAMSGYRDGGTESVHGEAQEGTLINFDDSRKFGFVKLKDGRTAFLHGSVLKGRSVSPGQSVRVVCAPSFDAKKNRPGWKVVRVL